MLLSAALVAGLITPALAQQGPAYPRDGNAPAYPPGGNAPAYPPYAYPQGDGAPSYPQQSPSAQQGSYPQQGSYAQRNAGPPQGNDGRNGDGRNGDGRNGSYSQSGSYAQQGGYSQQGGYAQQGGYGQPGGTYSQRPYSQNDRASQNGNAPAYPPIGNAPAYSQQGGVPPGANPATGARPGNVIGSGMSMPMGNRASNIDQHDTGSEIAPNLPTPDLGPNASPVDFLRAAQGALASGRTGEAQQSLEQAQTRLLDRSVPYGQTNNPSDNPAVVQITEALHALAAHDRQRCMALIQSAIPATEAMGR
jgi:hypothetical protein